MYETKAGDALSRVVDKSLKFKVLQQIRDYIVAAGLKEGDPLPTEKDLVEKLGLSRTVIRETLNRFESIGVIETRHGVGRFLGRFRFGNMADDLYYNSAGDEGAFRNIIELRLTLESAFLLRNLKSIADSDIGLLRDCLAEIKEYIRKGSDEGMLTVKHAEFHRIILRRSDNALLIDLFNMFSIVQQRLNEKHEYITRDRANFLAVHSQLVDAIEARDRQKVIHALSSHNEEPISWIGGQGDTFHRP